MSDTSNSDGAPSADTTSSGLESARHAARSEVAQALHDGVVQSITGLMMGLAVRSIDAPPAVRQALAEVELELSQVAAELRNVVSSLSSPRADADGRVD